MAQGIVPSLAAPSGRVWCLTFILSLSLVVWGYLQASPAFMLFATCYWGGLVFLLLSYWLRELIAEYKGWTEHMQK